MSRSMRAVRFVGAIFSTGPTRWRSVGAVLFLVAGLSGCALVPPEPVVLGPTIDGLRIIRSGVTGGEQIVVNGMQRVRPGMAVKAEQDVAGKQQVSPLAKR